MERSIIYSLTYVISPNKNELKSFQTRFFLIQINSDSFFQELSRREQARALDL